MTSAQAWTGSSITVIPSGGGIAWAKLAGQKSARATKPMPINGRMRSDSARKQLNNCPAMA